MPLPIPPRSSYAQIGQITSDEDRARDFCFQRGILNSNVCCRSCSAPMQLIKCATSKSPDGYIWRCSPCRSFQSLRHGSVLSAKKISFSLFLLLLHALSFVTSTNVDVANYTGLTEKSVGEWRKIIHRYVEHWISCNSVAIGGPGKIIEIDEAKFGKRKYHRGAYREGMWVLGGVCRDTGNCFLIPCPNNSRDAATLLPLIQRWVLPGTIIHTDMWSGYNGLTAAGFTHNTVNHSIQFVDPLTGVHTNHIEGMWYHTKRQMVGRADLDRTLTNFMFRRRFNATTGPNQQNNLFNGYLTVLKAP